MAFSVSRKRRLPEDEGDRSSLTDTYYKSNRRVCPHCGQSLMIKTYRTHKRLYYDQVFWLTPQHRHSA